MKNFVVFTLLFVTAAAFTVPEPSTLVSGRVFNGQDAEPHIAPFMIQLVRVSPPEAGELQMCGAVLLNSRWVLTAGHCLPTPNTTLVVAGQHDVRVVEPWEQRRSIERYYIHEDYCGFVCPNDIGLVYVDQPFVFDQYVQPIQLPGFEQIPTGIGRLFGWGLIGPGTFPVVLQVTDKPILDVTVCQQIWGWDLLDSTNLCTGPLDGSTNACSTDSGGPLVQFDANGQPIIVGIVSWGSPQCAEIPNAPAVYVRVSAFIDWIYRIAGIIDGV